MRCGTGTSGPAEPDVTQDVAATAPLPRPVPVVPADGSEGAARGARVRAPGAKGRTSLGWRIAAAAMAGVLIGGVLAVTRDAPPPGRVVATRTIGPSGGSLRFADGALVVPRGALSDATEITIRKSTPGRRITLQPPGERPRSFPPGTLDVYIFEPPSLEFREPVTVTLRLPARGVPGTAFVLVRDRPVFLASDADAADGRVTVRTTDFAFTGAET